MPTMNKLYEMAYLISPAYSEEEAQHFQQTLKNHVQNLGGLIEHEGEIIKKRLSYAVKDMTEAYLASFRFTMSPETIDAFKSKMDAKEILRFIITRAKRLPLRTRARPIIKSSTHEQTMPETRFPETVPASQTVQEHANIEEIDKKLEEILGKTG